MEALAQQVNQLSQQLSQYQQQFTELQQQLTAALASAQKAGTERTQALQLAAAAQQSAALAQQAVAAGTSSSNQPFLDTKALGQPPKLKRRDLFYQIGPNGSTKYSCLSALTSNSMEGE